MAALPGRAGRRDARHRGDPCPRRAGPGRRGRRQRARRGGAAEVIVVDGGSVDATREVAGTSRRQGDRSATRPGAADERGCRAGNRRGAAVSARRHRPAAAAPPTLVATRAGDARGSGRRFQLRRGGGRRPRPAAQHGRPSALPPHWVPYGDQALFLRRRTFRALGGYPDLPVMEDWELVARLRRLGRVVVLRESVVTSSASFVDHGVLWTGAVTLAVIVGYQLGIDACRLAAWRRASPAGHDHALPAQDTRGPRRDGRREPVTAGPSLSLTRRGRPAARDGQLPCLERGQGDSDQALANLVLKVPERLSSSLTQAWPLRQELGLRPGSNLLVQKGVTVSPSSCCHATSRR